MPSVKSHYEARMHYPPPLHVDRPDDYVQPRDARDGRQRLGLELRIAAPLPGDDKPLFRIGSRHPDDAVRLHAYMTLQIPP